MFVLNVTLAHLALSSLFNYSPILSQSQNNVAMRLDHIFASHLFQPLVFGKRFDGYIKLSDSSFQQILSPVVSINSISIEDFNVSTSRKVFRNDQVVITKCIFHKCKASSRTGNDGGAICASVSKVNISYCIFHDNSATNSGGAMRIDKSFSTEVSFTLFYRNRAKYSTGAALFHVVFDLRISSTNFTYNSSERKGASVSILNCEVSEINFVVDAMNGARDSHSWIFNNGETLVNECRFIKNGVMAVCSGQRFATVEFDSCEFVQNEMYGILWESKLPLTITNCVYDSNESLSVHMLSTCLFTKNDCLFSYNFDVEKVLLEIATVPATVHEKVVESGPMSDMDTLLTNRRATHSQFLPGCDDPDADEVIPEVRFWSVAIISVSCLTFLRYRKRQKQRIRSRQRNLAFGAIKPWETKHPENEKLFTTMDDTEA